ncbi:MAG: hypothetical protein ACREKI_04045 [Gemmatimonadota bacterium]
MFEDFPGLPVMFITIVALAGLLAGWFWATRTLRPELARRLAIVAAVWAGAYALVLLAASLTAPTQVLARGQEKRLCGFYLDCHRIVSVVGVQRVRALDLAGGARRAKGLYYLVTVRVRSDAVAREMRLRGPRVHIVDASGRRFSRDLEAEQAWARSRRATKTLDDPLPPGRAMTVDLIFDVAAGARDARLVVRPGWLEQISELFLIGDEDSLLHPPVTFRL